METKGPDVVLPELRGSYDLWKEWEGKKNDAKEAFFAFADQEIEQRGGVMTIVTVTALSQASAEERVRRHYPTWTIDVLRPHRTDPRTYEAVLKEIPAYLAFAIEHDGIKYSRTVSRGPVMVDEEWLLEEDPALYALVMFELPWGDIMPLPIEELDPEVLARLKKYIYNDKPRVSLGAPRPVKAESE